jgi:hypothetical protein
LWNSASGQALPLIIIVALGAGHIQLVLPSFKEFTPCVEIRLKALVNRNLNRNSTRLVTDKCSKAQQLSALECKGRRVLMAHAAAIDSPLKIYGTFGIMIELWMQSSYAAHVRYTYGNRCTIGWVLHPFCPTVLLLPTQRTFLD